MSDLVDFKAFCQAKKREKKQGGKQQKQRSNTSSSAPPPVAKQNGSSRNQSYASSKSAPATNRFGHKIAGEYVEDITQSAEYLAAQQAWDNEDQEVHKKKVETYGYGSAILRKPPAPQNPKHATMLLDTNFVAPKLERGKEVSKKGKKGKKAKRGKKGREAEYYDDCGSVIAKPIQFSDENLLEELDSALELALRIIKEENSFPVDFLQETMENGRILMRFNGNPPPKSELEKQQETEQMMNTFRQGRAGRGRRVVIKVLKNQAAREDVLQKLKMAEEAKVAGSIAAAAAEGQDDGNQDGELFDDGDMKFVWDSKEDDWKEISEEEYNTILASKKGSANASLNGSTGNGSLNKSTQPTRREESDEEDDNDAEDQWNENDEDEDDDLEDDDDDMEDEDQNADDQYPVENEDDEEICEELAHVAEPIYYATSAEDGQEDQEWNHQECDRGDEIWEPELKKQRFESVSAAEFEQAPAARADPPPTSSPALTFQQKLAKRLRGINVNSNNATTTTGATGEKEPVEPIQIDEASLQAIRKVEAKDRKFEQQEKRARARKILKSTSLQRTKLFNERLQKKKNLPAYKLKDEFLEFVAGLDVLVLCGETGSGKTTQLPQLMLDYFKQEQQFFHGKSTSKIKIICTQPRRLSATSVAERVAWERGEEIGQSVGYQVRFDSQLDKSNTELIFCTVGILLKMLESNPLLDGINCVMVDEVHERGLDTDFLLLVLRDICVRRKQTQKKDLKIIMMSASIDASGFLNYFKTNVHDSGTLSSTYLSVDLFEIPGKTNYPITEYFAEDIVDLFDDARETAAKKLQHVFVNKQASKTEELVAHFATSKFGNRISDSEQRKAYGQKFDVAFISRVIEYLEWMERNDKEKGAVLIFAPGWMEIQDVVKTLEALEEARRKRSFQCLRLHSSVPKAEQKRIFNRPPPGMRKIIVATNIAETSITVDDVVHVIDAGFHKAKTYDPETNLSGLETFRVAKSNVRQRRGRAGRCRAGNFFKLYTKHEFENAFLDHEKPEMLRTPVEELCLRVKAMKLAGADNASSLSIQYANIAEALTRAIAPPESQTVQNAVLLLKSIGALSWANEALTPVGQKLSELAMHPLLAKVCLLGSVMSGTGSAFDSLSSLASSTSSICITLGAKPPFYKPAGREQEASAKRKSLGQGMFSDHYLLADIMRQYRQKNQGQNHRAGDWCDSCFLDKSAMEANAKEIKDLLIKVKGVAISISSSPNSSIGSGTVPGTLRKAGGMSSGTVSKASGAISSRNQPRSRNDGYEILKDDDRSAGGNNSTAAGSDPNCLLNHILTACLNVAVCRESSGIYQCLVDRTKVWPQRESLCDQLVKQEKGAKRKDQEATFYAIAFYERTRAAQKDSPKDTKNKNKDVRPAIHNVRDCSMVESLLSLILLAPQYQISWLRWDYSMENKKTDVKHQIFDVSSLVETHYWGTKREPWKSEELEESFLLQVPNRRVAEFLMKIRPKLLAFMDYAISSMKDGYNSRRAYNPRRDNALSDVVRKLRKVLEHTSVGAGDSIKSIGDVPLGEGAVAKTQFIEKYGKAAEIDIE